MIHHLKSVQSLSKKKQVGLKLLPIQTALSKKTAGEWLERQVCLDGVSINSLNLSFNQQP